MISSALPSPGHQLTRLGGGKTQVGAVGVAVDVAVGVGLGEAVGVGVGVPCGRGAGVGRTEALGDGGGVR